MQLISQSLCDELCSILYILQDVLAKIIEAPSPSSIQSSIVRLQDLGALNMNMVCTITYIHMYIMYTHVHVPCMALLDFML